MVNVKQAIEELYTDHYSTYVRLMNKILKGDYETAEDIVQESFEKAFRNSNQFDPNKGRIRTWFNKIMYTTLVDYQRRNKDIETKPPDNVSNYEVVYDLPISMRDGIDKLIDEEISKVRNKKHRKVLHLFFIKGYTSKEISVHMSISQSNVTTIVTRFRQFVGG